MFNPPDPRKVAWQQKQRENEARLRLEVEKCYKQHSTGQARYAKSAHAQCMVLGVCVCNMKVA